MSKRKDDIKALRNEFKEEQKILLNRLTKLEKVNKRNKHIILIMLITCLFISGITSVLSYSLGASSVEYTSKDANWDVSNTQQAIDDLYNSLGSSLVGSVYSYMGVNVPFGYLACDGSTYNIEDYPRLANHINSNFGSYNYFGGDGETTFAVPDLRGEFLRGTGTNSHTNTNLGLPEGSGAAVGVHQEATSQEEIWRYNGSLYFDNTSTKRTQQWDASKENNGTRTRLTGTVSEKDPYPNDLYTSRPTNTSVLYIIKY